MTSDPPAPLLELLPARRTRGPGLIAGFYSLFTPLNTAVFGRTRNLAAYRSTQLLSILLLPFLVTLALGGFGPSSAVMLWAALCPLGSLLLEELKKTLLWIVGFIVLLVAGALAEPYLSPPGLPEGLVRWFFVLNLGTVVGVTFALLYYFVGQRDYFQERSEMLLLNILPREISETLKAGPRTIAEQFDEVSILFADVVEFTPMAAGMTPLSLVDLLNDVFQCFDTLVEKYDLEKIRRSAAGLPHRDQFGAGGGGPVQITERTWRLVKDSFQCEERGTVDVKGAVRPRSGTC